MLHIALCTWYMCYEVTDFTNAKFFVLHQIFERDKLTVIAMVEDEKGDREGEG